MEKMVEQWTWKHKVVGSTPIYVGGSVLKKIFIHTFVKFNIRKVLVEACLKNSLLQYNSVQRDPMVQCHPRIWTHALVKGPVIN